MKIKLEFPKNFLWGSATASYQVEGGIYNNDWAQAADTTGKVPHAGESTDHYNRYKADFDLAKSLGHNAHRISIEWSRIEPEEGKFNLAEIEHYKKVIRALKARGLTPLVTLWHFTSPIWFNDKGGFYQKDAPKIFARYCAFVVSALRNEIADDVFVATMNEPIVWSQNAWFSGNWPPFKKTVWAFLRVVKNLMRSHNAAYDEIKKATPQVNVGLVKNNMHFTADWKPWNKIAAWFMRWFWNHRFLKATYKKCDHIGLNYYFHTHFYKPFGMPLGTPKNDMGWNLDPAGLYYVLMELRQYNKPVYVTEAGLADRNDTYRTEYIRGLVQSSHRAIVDGLDLRGFMYWSLLDNFEWAHGYDQEFGLVHVNRKTQERIVRPSALVYKTICESNTLTLE